MKVSYELGLYWFIAHMLTIGGLIGGLFFSTRPEGITNPGEKNFYGWTHPAGYSVDDFLCLLAFNCCTPIGVALATAVCLQLCRLPTRGFGACFSKVTIIFSFIVVFGTTIWYIFMSGFADIWKCGVIACYADESVEPVYDQGNYNFAGWLQFTSLCIIPAFAILIVLFLWFCVCCVRSSLNDTDVKRVGEREPLNESGINAHEMSFGRSQDGSFGPNKAKPWMNSIEVHPVFTWGKFWMMLLVLFLILFVGALTTILPNDFRYYRLGTLKSYAAYKVIGKRENDRVCNWSNYVPKGVKPPGQYDHHICPEYLNRTWHSFGVKIDEKLTLKFYPDCEIYTITLVFMLLGGCLCSWTPPLRRLMGYRILPGIPVPRLDALVPALFSKKTPSLGRTISLTVGAALFWSFFLVSAWLFFYYWYFQHQWMRFPFGSADQPGLSYQDRLGRAFGQLSVYFMSFTMLPISQNSIFTYMMDIPRDALINYHIALGFFAFAWTFAHWVCFLIVYKQFGFLTHDVFSVPMYFPPDYYPDGHRNGTPKGRNFTIPLSTIITYVGFFVMIWVPAIRRKFYGFFLLTHHYFLILIPMILWHATSAWCFLVIPMTLWFVDRIVRICNSLRPAYLVDVVDHGDDILELAIKSESIRTKQFKAGQYIYLNVPVASPFTWHPITVSSSPLDNVIRLHIKKYGTWSQNLWGALVGRRLTNRSSEEITVSIQGPYGEPPSISPLIYQKIVLVCGGIGITPAISMLRTLYAVSCETGVMHLPNKVLLLWTGRDVTTFHAFEDTIYELQRSPYTSEVLEIVLFMTANRDPEADPPAKDFKSKPSRSPRTPRQGYGSLEGQPAALVYRYQRPQVMEEIRMRGAAPEEGERGLLFACGPGSLIEHCKVAAEQLGFEFHNEKFEW